MKSLRKKILASALAMTLVGGVFAPKVSMASPFSYGKPATEKQIGDKLKITKILHKVDKGVTTPNENFTFRFTPYDENDPAIPDVVIPFDSTDNTDAYIDEDGIQVEKFKEVDLSNITWPGTGEYIYNLQEVIPDNPTDDMKYGLIKNYSTRGPAFVNQGKGLDVRIYVEDVEGKLKATKFTAVARYSKFTYKAEYGEKGIIFKNNYDKKGGNDNPGGGTDITEADKKGFAFKKIVSNGTEEDNNKEFEFTVKVDKAVGSNSEDTVFKYKKVDKDGGASGEQSVKYGEEFKVKLKHNERIVFTDVILGSKVSVTENDSQGLTPSITSTFFEKDNESSDDKTKVAGYIGDQAGGNFAEITNKKIIITGVLIDNLPYIALVAVAGLGIFFFVKNRREEEIYA